MLYIYILYIYIYIYIPEKLTKTHFPDPVKRVSEIYNQIDTIQVEIMGATRRAHGHVYRGFLGSLRRVDSHEFG